MNLDRIVNNRSVLDSSLFFHLFPVNSPISKIFFSNISTFKPMAASLDRLNWMESCCSLICQKIAKIWKAFCNAISSCFSSVYGYISPLFVTGYPTININMSKEALQKIYWGLGKENKWREYIDGTHHRFGKDVYDKGLHNDTVEPGFSASMEKGCAFVEQYLNKKIDADWYLKLHKITCGHFNIDLVRSDAVLMGQERVGVFRDLDDPPEAFLPGGHYSLSKRAKAEFEALDAEIKKEFGPSYGIGEMIYCDRISEIKEGKTVVSYAPWSVNRVSGITQGTALIKYRQMSRYQIKRIFTKFINEFYSEVEKARSPDEKLWAIAKCFQRLEWLHSPRDGCGRTDLALLNKLLVDYGFHPAILEYPYVSSCSTLQHWKEYLQKGLVKWEQERAKLNR